MIKRIFLRSLVISIVSIFVFAICSSFLLYNFDKKQQTKSLLLYLNSVSTFADLSTDYQQSSEQIADLYGEELRITILDLNGNVLADSEVNAAELENHKNRAEVIDAITVGEGSSVRYSTTISKNVLYAAVRINQSNLIIRGMFPISDLFSNFFSLLPYIILSAFFAFIVSLLLAKKLAKDTLVPLLNINDSMLKMLHDDFNIILPYSKYDELNSLIKSVNLLSREISCSLNIQQNEKEKLSFILDNISQGVILIDNYYNLIHYNRSALKIFNLEDRTATTLFQITRNNSIINSIENALKNKVMKFDLTIKETEEIYTVTVMPLHAKNYENTILILLTNVTQARNNERIRKEFFSNASHELRTPITSIMGFSELIKDNSETDIQEMKGYAAIINKESNKLTDILDGILTISALEEHSSTKMNEIININEILVEIRNVVKSICAVNNISLHINCADNIRLKISKDDFVSIMNNLIDNAIKYGKEKGNIWIEVVKNSNDITLKIKDDGMGIAKIDLPRIFERFYRTDKTRNTKIKGSGIGLAIVKHIILKYGAEINVESTEGLGTTFIIKFNNL